MFSEHFVQAWPHLSGLTSQVWWEGIHQLTGGVGQPGQNGKKWALRQNRRTSSLELPSEMATRSAAHNNTDVSSRGAGGQASNIKVLAELVHSGGSGGCGPRLFLSCRRVWAVPAALWFVDASLWSGSTFTFFSGCPCVCIPNLLSLIKTPVARFRVHTSASIWSRIP